MIKIKRQDTEKVKLAKEELAEAKRKGSSYNTPNVNAALLEMFHGKCYICENKEITSCEIEHLHPHRGNTDLIYDWDNLFYVCRHCNGIKLDKYEPIIDCTKEDPEKLIAFRKKGYFGVEEKLDFEVLDDREDVQNTVKLLTDVYYGTTAQKKIEATSIRKKLRKELMKFKYCVREYHEAESDEKEDLEALLRKELKDSSPFAAFKRQLIRDNTYFSEIMQYMP